MQMSLLWFHIQKMNSDSIDKIVEEVTKQVYKRLNTSELIKVESSARHVHLSQDILELLFGSNSVLDKSREISQPGQFLSKQRVKLKTEKNTIDNVAIIGPLRDKTQVEISLTDAKFLGIDAPIKHSGDLDESVGITLCANNREVEIKKGVIIAARHMHMSSEDAQKHGVNDKDVVSVEIAGQRELIYKKVLVRVRDDFATRMHLDLDEANACAFERDQTYAKVLK